MRAYNIQSLMTGVGACQSPVYDLLQTGFGEDRSLFRSGCSSGKQQNTSSCNHSSAIAIKSSLLGERRGFDLDGPFIGLET